MGQEGSAGHGQSAVWAALLRESQAQGCVPLGSWPEEAGPAAPPPGRERVSDTPGNGIRLLVPPLGHSRGLGTRVLVAAPADGLGPLPVVTQVPLDHVVVALAPAAVFGKLDPCGKGRLTWAWSRQAPAALLEPWDGELWRAWRANPTSPCASAPLLPWALSEAALICPSHASLA